MLYMLLCVGVKARIEGHSFLHPSQEKINKIYLHSANTKDTWNWSLNHYIAVLGVANDTTLKLHHRHHRFLYDTKHTSYHHNNPEVNENVTIGKILNSMKYWNEGLNLEPLMKLSFKEFSCCHIHRNNNMYPGIFFWPIPTMHIKNTFSSMWEAGICHP